MEETKKTEFVKAFREATGLAAEDFKGKPKEFAVELNKEGRDGLRGLFRAAKKEYDDRPKSEEDTAQGLGALFEGA